jgi:YetA-like protein
VTRRTAIGLIAGSSGAAFAQSDGPAPITLDWPGGAPPPLETGVSLGVPYVLDGRVGTYNLATIMGGGEVVFELNTLIAHPAWKKAWNQYCRLHTAPQDVIARDTLLAPRAPTAGTRVPAAWRAICTCSLARLSRSHRSPRHVRRPHARAMSGHCLRKTGHRPDTNCA